MTKGSIVILAFVTIGLMLLAPQTTKAAPLPELSFSTELNFTSWTISKITTGFQISFRNLVVDWCQPASANLIGDQVIIPNMNLTVVTDNGMGIITAILTPTDNYIYIRDDFGSGNVMVAQISSGLMLNIWKDFVAYTNQQNDLSSVNTPIPGYSAVLDEFVTAQANGLEIDLTFSGDSASSIYDLLHGSSNTPVSGVMSGHIAAIPEPATILLLGIGIVSSTNNLAKIKRKKN